MIYIGVFGNLDIRFVCFRHEYLEPRQLIGHPFARDNWGIPVYGKYKHLYILIQIFPGNIDYQLLTLRANNLSYHFLLFLRNAPKEHSFHMTIIILKTPFDNNQAKNEERKKTVEP